MAPQQNSTLIDDNLDACPSLLNLPEIINRYSPILPARNQRNHQSDSNNNNNNHHHNNSSNNNNKQCTSSDKYDNCQQLQSKTQQQSIQQLEAPYHQVTYNQHQQQQQQKIAKHLRYGTSNRSGSHRSRRSRSISLHGFNSTVEQGNKEIPIWLDDEPRYVSGVTNKTTCNDIIKALIDDEIHNGNFAYCSKRTAAVAERQIKDGGNASASSNGNGNGNAITASRDYSDYVITESWRGIERSYDGKMAILPVWKAWSRVHNELRLALKHKNDIRDPTKSLKSKNSFASLMKYLRKILRFSKNSKSNGSNKKLAIENTNKSAEQFLLCSKHEIPDEFLFVILPDKVYTCDEPQLRLENETHADEAKKLKEKLYRLAETPPTNTNNNNSRSSNKRSNAKHQHKRHKEKYSLQHRRSSGAAVDASNCIRRRKDAPIRSSIRQKLAQKTVEVDQLYEREYALTKQLVDKCKLYKLQNELYTNPSKQLEISVEKVQRNIEDYANEIVQTEHELQELKNEIKQDISIINNLKRLTIETEVNDVPAPAELQNKKSSTLTANIGQSTPRTAVRETMPATAPMQFVDNIYEFCDNNASMLV